MKAATGSWYVRQDLSERAGNLEDLGVEVNLNSLVTEIEAGRIKVGEKWIDCDVVVWATGVAASHLGKDLGRKPTKPDEFLSGPI